MYRTPNVAKDLTIAPLVALSAGRPRRTVGVQAALAPLLMLCGLFSSDALAAPESTRRTVTIHWDRVPLRDALPRLAEVFEEPVFVDRRVDPNRRLSLNVKAASLDDVLAAIAAESSLGVSRLGALAYLGPRPAAEQLRTVATLRRDEAARLTAGRRAGLLRQEPINWPRLTDPRGLVTTLIERAGWRAAQTERSPHDLWAAGSLPELTLSEQLTVLLIGFDLTFQVNAGRRTVEIVPLAPATIGRRYRLPSRPSDPVALLQQQLPRAVARVEGETMWVEARVEDHERLMELLGRSAARSTAGRPRPESRQVYTLRVEQQPVGAIIGELAERLHWPLEIDAASIEAAGLSLDTRVSFSVENSDKAELLDALLRPAGLDYRQVNGRLRIVPGAPDKR